MRTACALVCCLTVSIATETLADPTIGLNLARNRYFTREVAFVDAFKHFSGFQPQQTGAAWGVADANALTLGANGYPTAIAPDHDALAIWDVPPGYPDEPHLLLWDGVGNVATRFVPEQDILASGEGWMMLDVQSDAADGRRIGVVIDTSDEHDPIRNIRLVPATEAASHIGAPPSNPFRQEFLQRWSPMTSFRYNNWTNTGLDEVADWIDRPLTTDATQTTRGVALEYQIAHANETRANPWFNIPHTATDDYVRDAATMIRDDLSEGLVARVEYSNEVWNGIFPQAEYARQQAPSLQGEQADYTGQLRWYSKRSVEIFEIFEEVFTFGGADPAGMDRLVRVVASQAANSWTAQTVLDYDDAYEHVDALAIAPYFGAYPQTTAQADAWKQATPAGRVEMAEQEFREAIGHIDTHVALLQDTQDDGSPRYGDIELFAYEGGQHFLSHPDLHSDTELTEVWYELNRDPAMRDFYLRYLGYWDAVGGGDFMLFSSTENPSVWGSWGLMEYEGQPLEETPKLQGVLDYLEFAEEFGFTPAALDRLAALARETEPTADLNGDGVVTFEPGPAGDVVSDSDFFVRSILRTEYGDANLDGVIDAADFSVLTANFTATGAGWAQGDFNGDTVVDSRDLSLIFANWGYDRSAVLADQLATPIPEPSAIAALLLFLATWRATTLLDRSPRVVTPPCHHTHP